MLYVKHSGKALRLVMTAFLMLSAVSAFAQKISVSGKVVSASDGFPIMGGGVLASDGTGTVTDMDGNYTLSVPSGASITFSFMGFKDAVELVNGRTVIDVKLIEDNKFLDEVVVLGYTSQKKNELSSSVVSLKSEELLNASTPNLGNMLQGKAAGVFVSNSTGQPGAEADIRIRGTGSISAGAGPLYVVDGIAGGSFNPNDVETVTILKDASATALYGAAAAGGVIVVTTKSAKDRDRVDVNFKLSGGIKKALSGRFKPMDSYELYNAHKGLYPKAIFSSQRPKELLDQDFDWMNAFFQIGSVQDYYVSVAGTSGRVNYFVSLDHYDEVGSLINTNFKRNSGRVNLSTPIGDRVTLNVRLNYKKSEDQLESSYTTLEAAYRTLPWDIPYVQDAEGNYTSEYLYVDNVTRSDNGKQWWSHDKFNELHSQIYNYNREYNEGFVADAQLIWNITDWLSFTSTNRYDSSNYFNVQYTDPRTKTPSYGKAGNLENSYSSWGGWGTTNLLKAHGQFGLHNVSGIIGAELSHGASRQMSAAGDQMPNGQASLSNTVMKSVKGYDYQTAAYAFLAQAQYSYNEKYIATASIRYDATYKFAPKTRAGFFPGVSAAWIISKETFLKDVAAVNLLKLRAGYGKTGNDSIEAFLYQDSYDLTAQYNNIVAAIATRQANPELGWEEAYMASLGVEGRFFDRLNVTVDLYNTTNTNILLDVPRAPSSGFTKFTQNIGTIRNRGVELAADADIIKSKDWNWNFGLNIGLNQNRVMYLPNGEFNQGDKPYQQVKVGQDLYSWYMPKWAGVDPENGNPLWEKVAGDGSVTTTSEYTEASYQVCGTASPVFTGGLTTGLRWKNFTLTANANIVFGNKIYNATRQVMDSDGAYTDYNLMSLDNGLGWSRWKEKGDIATHPKLTLNGNKDAHMYSSRYLEDGSYLRLKNVTIAYNLPKPVFRGFVKGGRIYVSGDNLLTLSRFSGMDPEVRLEATSWSLAGEYSNNYPVPMSVILGVDIKF